MGLGREKGEPGALYPHYFDYRLVRAIWQERLDQAAAERRYLEAAQLHRQELCLRDAGEGGRLSRAWRHLLTWLARRPAL